MGSSRKVVTTVTTNLSPDQFHSGPTIRLHALRAFIRECEDAGLPEDQKCVIDDYIIRSTLEEAVK